MKNYWNKSDVVCIYMEDWMTFMFKTIIGMPHPLKSCKKFFNSSTTHEVDKSKFRRADNKIWRFSKEKNKISVSVSRLSSISIKPLHWIHLPYLKWYCTYNVISSPNHYHHRLLRKLQAKTHEAIFAMPRSTSVPNGLIPSCFSC